MPFDVSVGAGSERLLRLAQLLQNVPSDDTYNFIPFGWLSHDHFNSPRDTPLISGCAVGYALHHGLFDREGLVAAEDASLYANFYFVPQYGEKRGYNAVADFFEISLDQAEKFFYLLIAEGDVNALIDAIHAHVTKEMVA